MWRGWMWVATAGACLGVLAGGGRGDVEGRVLEVVQGARGVAGVGRLERRADLDALARERAAYVASLPHRKRMEEGAAIGKELQRAGIEYRRVSLHLDLNRGYQDPSDGFVKSWSGYEVSWETALDEAFDAVGLGAVTADDGWVVLAVVFLDEPLVHPPPDPGELEARTFQQVNRVRRERGLNELSLNPALSDVARAHSRDMALRHYFAHVAPDGSNAGDRVQRYGLKYGRIGENLHRNSGVYDIVGTAVQSWLSSREHRRLIESPKFRETGVGVALDEEGTVFFTQLFFTSPGSD